MTAPQPSSASSGEPGPSSSAASGTTWRWWRTLLGGLLVIFLVLPLSCVGYFAYLYGTNPAVDLSLTELHSRTGVNFPSSTQILRANLRRGFQSESLAVALEMPPADAQALVDELSAKETWSRLDSSPPEDDSPDPEWAHLWRAEVQRLGGLGGEPGWWQEVEVSEGARFSGSPGTPPKAQSPSVSVLFDLDPAHAAVPVYVVILYP